MFMSFIPAKFCICFVFKTDMSFVCVAISVVFVSVNDICDCNVLLYAMSLKSKVLDYHLRLVAILRHCLYLHVLL